MVKEKRVILLANNKSRIDNNTSKAHGKVTSNKGGRIYHGTL